MPFTAQQFFDVFGRYHAALWPAPVFLNVVAVVAIVLAWRGRANDGRWVSGILVALWAWMAVAYHGAFFAAINPAAWLFAFVFLLQAAWLAWQGIVRARLRFAFRRDVLGWMGSALLAYALVVYPLAGWALGHRYPETPTFGLPCPTTIFTIGLLMFAVPPMPRSVLAIPVLWAAVGASAAFLLGVYQDLGLLAAAAAAVVAFFRLGPRRPVPAAFPAGRGAPSARLKGPLKGHR
jgi:hypothetical protein